MTALRCLTPKEIQVCELLARGLTYKAIAFHLGISHRTVNEHACNIYSKLGIQRKTGGLLKVLESNNFNAPPTEYCQSKEQRIKVYQLKKEGLRIQEIAVKLRISPEDVYRHIGSIKWFIRAKGNNCTKIKGDRYANSIMRTHMKTVVLSLDGDEEIGEVDNVAQLVDLLKEWGLTPDDIWFSIPNDALWDELIEGWK